jgi:DNA replication protein DnaC
MFQLWEGSEVKAMKDTFEAVLGRILATPELTPEQREARNRELAEERRRERNSKLWDAWNALTGPMGTRYKDCRLDNFAIDDKSPHAAVQRTVLTELQSYAENIIERVGDGQGLLPYGPSGTGKDHLLVGLSRVAIANEISIKWINGSTLYRSMREGMGEDEEELVNRYIYPAVLYLSDPIPPVGSLTPFQASTLFAIIDGRYRDKKATWATMNVAGGAEATQRLGAAIADRLRDGAVSLNCAWPSFRKGAT